MNLNLEQLFLLFIIYSFIGWVGEVIYCSIPEKHFINRGFLHGPVCPIYGCGGLLVVFLLMPFKDTWVELFFAAMFVTTVLEYFTSWLMEVLFHNRWWDYSHYKLNINGRVCLLNSLIFGAMGTLALHFVHPPIKWLICQIKSPFIEIASGALFVWFVTDLILTVRTLKMFNQKLEELKEFSTSLKNKFKGEIWVESGNILEMFKSLRERAKQDSSPIFAALSERLETLNRKYKSSLRILQAFPRMQSKRYGEQLEHFKFQLKVEFALKKEMLKAKYAQKKGEPCEAASREEIIKRLEEQTKPAASLK